MEMAEVANMTHLERIQAMEVLWDALSHDGTPLESPEWHEAVLNERRQQIAAGEVKFISLDELKQKFRS